MESKLTIKFLAENEEFQLDISQPDLAKLIHFVVEEHLNVTNDNITIETENEEFDKDEFKEIFITVSEEFRDEIDIFFENIKNDIKTYYSNEELSNEIINKIKGSTDKVES